MASVVTFTARRTFLNSFIVMAKLWFTTPWGYLVVAGMVAAMAFAFYDPAPLWLAILGGLAWAAVMLPFLLALQAWKILSWSRKFGLPMFSFGEDGAVCTSREIATRIGWSAIKRVRLTRRTCFVYLTSNVAWFFDRRDLSNQELATVADFAHRANVKLIGTVPA